MAEALKNFISYSHEDAKFAERLSRGLEAAGKALWRDRQSLMPGAYDREIQEALTNCYRVLVLLSPAAVSSDFVLDEVTFALNKKKIVIPLLYRACEIPLRLTRLQYVDFTRDYAGGMKQLLEYVSLEEDASESDQQSAFVEQKKEGKGFSGVAEGESASQRGEHSKRHSKASAQTSSDSTTKRIVFCADGMWDTDVSGTNVCRFYKALTLNRNQMPFYDEGWGADGKPISNVVGGAIREGLWQKVMRGYAKIAQVHMPGDELFLIGFSRGAYTARSLAGMIAAVGLPTQNFTDDLVETAFTAYREKLDRTKWLAKLKKCNMYVPDIKMVGVWDTVGAFGIPGSFPGFDPYIHGFLSNQLSPRVKNAFQALSIDERRAQFLPTLWTGEPAAGQKVEQVWFTGCHGDVGGAHQSPRSDTSTLEEITLGWMVEKGRSLGLTFDPIFLEKFKLPLPRVYSTGDMSDSWSKVYGPPKWRQIPKGETLANSVRFRSEQDWSYRPKALKFTNGALSNQYPLDVVVNESN